MPDLLQDLKFALRQLRRSPGYAFTVILTLALAAGASSAMVGVLRATLLHSLPYPDPGKLVTVTDLNTRGFKSNGLVTVLRADDLAHARANGHSLFSNSGYLYLEDATLSVNGSEPLRLPSAAVSGSFFATIAAKPLLGSSFTPADDYPGRPQLVVLSYRLWQSVFAGDPGVLGRVVHLGQEQATVIGVMPPDFNLPEGVDLWHPGHVPPSNFGNYRGDGSRFVQVFARLAPGQTLASARQGTEGLAQQLAHRYPDTDAGWTFQVTDLRDTFFGTYKSALLLLATAVMLVLLAAASNIAGLQVSRYSARAGELSIRDALGITRGRLLRLLFAEGALLLISGSLLGLALAPVFLRLAGTHLPASLLQVGTPHLDLSVFLISTAVLLAVGTTSALLPAFRSSRLSRAQGSGGVVGGDRSPSPTRLGGGLVVIQIALSLVLLTASAGVLTRLYKLLSVPLGFQPDHLLTLTVDLPWNFNTERARQLYLQVEERFAAMPGVQAAGATMALPLYTFSLRDAHDIVGQAPTPHHDAVTAEVRQISPGYLRTMQIPLLAGRALTVRDTEPKVPPVVLVNQSFAKAYFGATTPVGRRLENAGGSLEIVGVVGDTQGTGGPLTATSRPEIFYPENGGWPHMQFALRSTLPPADLNRQVRQIVASLDPAASPGYLVSFPATLGRALQAPRLNAGLLTAFAGLSLLLVVIGIYSLVAFQVTRRTREIGLRLALGSTRTGILALLLQESSVLLVTGLTLGMAATLIATRLLRHVMALGPAAPWLLWLLPGMLLLSAAVLASTALPARRAALLDPNKALKVT